MNRLSTATSPYLLQHAHNPVDWFEWGVDAFAIAKKENKPVLVSIGYSSCHWCHVMERQSFEDADVAAVMNEFLVCIKVDREERPDIDHIYMDAVQAMGMNGGWPLNVFVTPEGKPFYGGTYFPPAQWVSLIRNLNAAWKSRAHEILESANDLTTHLQQLDTGRWSNANASLESDFFLKLEETLAANFDWEYGGTAGAPKFIMPSVWSLLLRLHLQNHSTAAMAMVVKTLEKTASGGIFDQLAGGFARYSVDEKWFAPHFEKMLFDNGQLLSLFAEAYAVNPNPLFRSVVHKTIAWLESEMMDAQGGFYSALDADSEGVEGKFYVWTAEEVQAACGPDAPLVMDWFGCTPGGNWEHGLNILTSAWTTEGFVEAKKIEAKDWQTTLVRASRQLLEVRSKRIRPSLDDKILLGWNAIAISGLVDAYRYMQNEAALPLALKSIGFLESNMVGATAIRSYRKKASPTEGFLEDYAYLIQAYVQLYQATFQETYLLKARDWCQYTLTHFFDETDGYFHFAGKNAEKLITRKKEIFDNVIPASNSVMARNLLALAVYFENTEWHSIAAAMVSKLTATMRTDPRYLSNWAMAGLELQNEFTEVVIAGPDCHHLASELRQHFLPHVLFAGAPVESALPLLHNRVPKDGATLIYVCQKGACQLPVATATEALVQIQALGKYWKSSRK